MCVPCPHVHTSEGPRERKVSDVGSEEEGSDSDSHHSDRPLLQINTHKKKVFWKKVCGRRNSRREGLEVVAT